MIALKQFLELTKYNLKEMTNKMKLLIKVTIVKKQYKNLLSNNLKIFTIIMKRFTIISMISKAKYLI